MKYQKRDGSFGCYPHSFGYKDLHQLEDFLQDGTQTMSDSLSGSAQTVMRHDVDHNLEHAAKFAKWEHERNLKSTYFVLHTAWYYQDRDRLKRGLDEIVSYGHEIGIHNDAVSQAQAEGHTGEAVWDRAGRILCQKIADLRHQGFQVVGTAAHGGVGALANLDLWDHIDLAKLGLQYEAYHLHRGTNYISDNRGEWRAPMAHVPGKVTHMLVHPCHWLFP